MYLKMSSGKHRPFCLIINVLTCPSQYMCSYPFIWHPPIIKMWCKWTFILYPSLSYNTGSIDNEARLEIWKSIWQLGDVYYGESNPALNISEGHKLDYKQVFSCKWLTSQYILTDRQFGYRSHCPVPLLLIDVLWISVPPSGHECQ